MNKNGFTLIEILLVVAIMAILATMSAVSTTKTVSKMQFQGTFNKVEQIFHDARSMALSGKQIDDCTDIDNDPSTEHVVAAGYGVNIKKGDSSFVLTLFSDAHTFDTGEFEDPEGGCGDRIESVLELTDEYKLDKENSFVYIPPNAVYLNGEDVTIKLETVKYFQEIFINSAGVIEKLELTGK
jgi:prepilin-type N-terminal cleavage/methylation domain-containing protein